MTPTTKVHLYWAPSATQLSENFDRGPLVKGEVPSRRGGIKFRFWEAEDEEGEEDLEEEESHETEVAYSPEAPKVPNLTLYSQSLVYQA
ncbi:hypothetical protein O181_070159 [Austropuccinia psidii MF-1]|uniref:Uncharacterized protein n=1 Tax=Austropuccinia psidii MF-1 TaxID=1389203 RepID=A0A9Q3F093_9BASI|nr:hypothetical protein [Austropuccinia psidii MF-1]